MTNLRERFARLPVPITIEDTRVAWCVFEDLLVMVLSDKGRAIVGIGAAAQRWREIYYFCN